MRQLTNQESQQISGAVSLSNMLNGMFSLSRNWGTPSKMEHLPFEIEPSKDMIENGKAVESISKGYIKDGKAFQIFIKG